MRECWLCGTTVNLQKHHVFFGTANRKKSEKHGMVVDLCLYCHLKVHKDIEVNLSLKRYFQREFETKYDRGMFMREFGRNYL